MVQYVKLDPQKRNPHNHYWKLPDKQSLATNNGSNAKQILAQHKYGYVKTSKTVEQLPRYVYNALRGFYSYQSCSVTEMKRVVRDRRLRTRGRGPLKRDLIVTLETADEGLSFRRFGALPAELRCRICTYYFESLETLHAPAQPPVTRVSRLLRTEALPLFYKSCRFAFRWFACREPGPIWIAEAETKTANFLSGVSQDHLAEIGRSEIFTTNTVRALKPTLSWTEAERMVFNVTACSRGGLQAGPVKWSR